MILMLDLMKTKKVTADNQDATLTRYVDYRGEGWYSLMDNTYYFGVFPTLSRIKIEERTKENGK